MDAFVLKGENKDALVGYVLNKAYNHETVRQKGVPEFIYNAGLTIKDIAAGSYDVRFFDCLEGVEIATEAVETTSDELFVPIPSFLWGVHFQVFPGEPIS